MKSIAAVRVHRVTEAGMAAQPTDDEVAVEEPLEIRVAEEPLVITMRTPGEDPRLTLGFLFAEGIVSSAGDIGSIAHCGRPGEQGYGNTIEVTPAAGVVLEVERSRRGTLTTAACGVCGRQSIDDLLERCHRLPDGPILGREIITRAMTDLGKTQETFARTGGLHAAGALGKDGALLAAAEDVGRHNAVDKVVGHLLLDKAIGAATLLAVSGRLSFEIVQKAVVARIPIIVGVSAPSSLAVELSRSMNITLIGFARSTSFNIYSHPQRIG